MGKLMDAVKQKDVALVKQLVSEGQNPNKPMKLRGDQSNPYLYALMVSVWNGEASSELLEIVEFLTPHMTGYYFKDEDDSAMFRESYFGDLMLRAKSTGAFDVVIEAMLRGGYAFDKDPNLGRHIGYVSFPLAHKLLEQFGTDDGTSVCSAARSGNTDLVKYLLDKGVSPNQPIYFSNGNQVPALVSAVMLRHTDIVKMLLDAGADPKAKDTGYNMDAFEMAKATENEEIINLLKAVK